MGTSIVGHAFFTIWLFLTKPGANVQFVMRPFTKAILKGNPHLDVEERVEMLLDLHSISVSAVTSATPCFGVGDEITMQLMQRERGSVVALPKIRWKKTDGTPFRVNDGVDVCYAKLLVATEDEVLSNIIEREEKELSAAFRENEGCPEICFIEFASQQLQERKRKLQIGNATADCVINELDEKDDGVTMTVKISDTLKVVYMFTVSHFYLVLRIKQ